MKRVFVLLLLTLAVKVSICQDTTFTISKVVTVDSVSKDELYRRAKLWVATSYKSAQNVVQLDDKENATIVVKALFITYYTDGENESGHVNYTLTIQCKEGRYKYIFTDFFHDGGNSGFGSGGNLNNEKPICGGFWMPKGVWSQLKEQAVTYIKVLEDSLKRAMNNSLNAPQKDDW